VDSEHFEVIIDEETIQEERLSAEEMELINLWINWDNIEDSGRKQRADGSTRSRPEISKLVDTSELCFASAGEEEMRMTRSRANGHGLASFLSPLLYEAYQSKIMYRKPLPKGFGVALEGFVRRDE
jgi:hypothetical protein